MSPLQQTDRKTFKCNTFALFCLELLLKLLETKLRCLYYYETLNVPLIENFAKLPSNLKFSGRTNYHFLTAKIFRLVAKGNQLVMKDTNESVTLKLMSLYQSVPRALSNQREFRHSV